MGGMKIVELTENSGFSGGGVQICGSLILSKME